MRLIDAEGSELQTQLKIIRKAEYQIYGSGSWGFTAKCERAIEDAPTIQPEPQYKTNYGFMWLCPKCGLPIHSDYTRCVRCGHNREKGV